MAVERLSENSLVLSAFLNKLITNFLEDSNIEKSVFIILSDFAVGGQKDDENQKKSARAFDF